MKTAKFYTAAMTSALVAASLVAACSTDSGTVAGASDENDVETAETAYDPSSVIGASTIEFTGKASYDIVTMNARIAADYSYSAMPRNALGKTASSLVSEAFDNEPYAELAGKILGVAETAMDKLLDGFTLDVWSATKGELLDAFFPGDSGSDMQTAFKQVNDHLVNIENILDEMGKELENKMDVNDYQKVLSERHSLYTLLRRGLFELQSKIVDIDRNNTKYPTDEEKNAALVAAVQKWGDQSVGDATVGVQAARLYAYGLIEKITSTVSLPGVTNDYVSNYLNIYDIYAKHTLVWEQEGYAWRELMRAEDAKMVMELAAATKLYYTIVDENTTMLENLAEMVSDYKDYVAAHPIEYHSTPIYIKWGSKWAGQAFEADLATRNYAAVLNDKGWSAGETISNCTDKGASSRFLNEEVYKYNASRLYAGFEPYYVENPKNSYSLAGWFAMPEEWYKEVYEAYAVNGQRKSLMEIFKSVGFRFNSRELEIREFERDKFEQFFITNRRDYAVMYHVGGYSEFRVAIPVVTANSREGILTGTVQDHDAYALKYMAANRNDRSSLLCTGSRAFYKVTADYSDHRTFFYPVKARGSMVTHGPTGWDVNGPKIPN